MEESPIDSTNLERYREIVDDWDAFVDSAARPLPHVLRVNTLKSPPNALFARLRSRDVDVRPITWHEAAAVVDRPPGAQIEHWLGLYYIQESVQLLPVLALDPRPGETVLDLCAAPGGKTTHLADRMSNRGTLVANEPNGRRQMSLLANLNRLGVLNALVTAYQGENFPMQTAFDRILVDAPCSAEGTLRKESSLRNGAAPRMIERLARVQKRLIVRAFDLLAPGGVLVYSTCTFAPEENEAVVAHLLDSRDARVLPFEPQLPHCRGIVRWQDEAFPRAVEGCARLYPHHLDSGGGFVARISRA